MIGKMENATDKLVNTYLILVNFRYFKVHHPTTYNDFFKIKIRKTFPMAIDPISLRFPPVLPFWHFKNRFLKKVAETMMGE